MGLPEAVSAERAVRSTCWDSITSFWLALISICSALRTSLRTPASVDSDSSRCSLQSASPSLSSIVLVGSSVSTRRWFLRLASTRSVTLPPWVGLPSGGLSRRPHNPPSTIGRALSSSSNPTSTSSPTSGNHCMPRRSPAPGPATRAQALSSSDSVGNRTFTRHWCSGSSLLVTTPTTRLPQPLLSYRPVGAPPLTRSASCSGSLPPQTNRVVYGRLAP